LFQLFTVSVIATGSKFAIGIVALVANLLQVSKTPVVPVGKFRASAVDTGGAS
jgi:hypothetical protein